MKKGAPQGAFHFPDAISAIDQALASAFFF